jgi:hypothetical protein
MALALAPVAAGVTWALFDVALSARKPIEAWVPVGCGALIWTVVFLMLPKPMWLYVVGHELTHALWTWAFGGRVTAFKASAKGGHVVVSKSNAFIVLAPYFFPLYSILWAGAFLLATWAFGWHGHDFWFRLGVGLTYAFHVTLTAHVLRNRQPDIDGEGWLFSAVLVWLLHVIVLLVALPAVTGGMAPVDALARAAHRVGAVLMGIGRLAR